DAAAEAEVHPGCYAPLVPVALHFGIVERDRSLLGQELDARAAEREITGEQARSDLGAVVEVRDREAAGIDAGGAKHDFVGIGRRGPGPGDAELGIGAPPELDDRPGTQGPLDADR